MRLAVLLACAATFVAVPHAGADTSPLLVVRGSKPGWVDVTFTTSFRFDSGNFRESYRKGSIGGFWAERIGTTYSSVSDAFGYVRFGAGDVVAKVAQEKDPDPMQPSQEGYAPGRYRFHVVADGPFEVTLPFLAGPDHSVLVVAKHASAKPRLVAATGIATGGTVWDAREHVTIGSARTVAFSISVLGYAAGAHDDVDCFAARGADCAPDAATTPRYEAHAGVPAYSSTRWSVAGPGSLPAGAWDAVQRVVAAPGATVTSLRGYALLVAAPR